MHTLRTEDRVHSMTNLVSFHGVPMPRGLAFAIDHIEKHGAPVSIYSADRTVGAIAEHNKQFGTTLHAQEFLFDNQGKPGFNPANPPNRTSHCYFADGNPAYKDANGRVVAPGGQIPWYSLGIDISDKGKAEDCREFLRVAHKLGYEFIQPYSSGSEQHHVISVKSPIGTLEHWNVISKKRTA
ncbi:MAG: hypothetical protein QOE44_2984 [Solirubrobacteraceae bacterium]|nr:hypothetical protein [Solirubrobacteraceae bacterium]